MSNYSKIQKNRILQIALSSIQLSFKKLKFIIPSDWKDDSVLFEKRGTFVTLTKHGSLRGCIGSILPRQPLWEDVAENAVHAAFHDPRFDPMQEFEVPEIKIEVSVLTVPIHVKYSSFQELQQNIKPLVDGVIIQYGSAKATFLPQVWEDLPDPNEFFKHLCLKAGLPGNFFLTQYHDLKIETYQAEIISQDEGN
jgi:uncharacterized protein